MEKNIGISPVLASKWNCNSPKIDEGYCSNPVSPASSCCERVPVSPYVGDAPHPLKVPHPDLTGIELISSIQIRKGKSTCWVNRAKLIKQELLAYEAQILPEYYSRRLVREAAETRARETELWALEVELDRKAAELDAKLEADRLIVVEAKQRYLEAKEAEKIANLKPLLVQQPLEGFEYYKVVPPPNFSQPPPPNFSQPPPNIKALMPAASLPQMASNMSPMPAANMPKTASKMTSRPPNRPKTASKKPRPSLPTPMNVLDTAVLDFRVTANKSGDFKTDLPGPFGQSQQDPSDVLKRLLGMSL